LPIVASKVLDGRADEERNTSAIYVLPNGVAIVEIDCLKCDGGQAEANEGHNHHDYGSSLRDFLVFGERDVLLRGLEHTLTVARLLNVLLADGVSYILKHLHLHCAILLFACTLTSSATMADTAVDFVNVI
jgi:hypothetical protein